MTRPKKTEKKLTDLTAKELKVMIDEIIDRRLGERLLECFVDPHDELELKPEVIKRVKEARKLLRGRKHGIKLKE